jgi:hypothetical protein
MIPFDIWTTDNPAATNGRGSKDARADRAHGWYPVSGVLADNPHEALNIFLRGGGRFANRMRGKYRARRWESRARA